MNDQTEVSLAESNSSANHSESSDKHYLIAAEALLAAADIDWASLVEDEMADDYLELGINWWINKKKKRMIESLAGMLPALELHKNAAILRTFTGPNPATLDLAIKLSELSLAAGLPYCPDATGKVMQAAVLIDQYYAQEWQAYNVVAQYLGGKVVAGPSEPDVVIDGRTPVEIKTGDFNGAALRQLQRYMKKYNSDCGVAVGSKLTTELPKGITFVQIVFVEHLQEYGVVESHKSKPTH